MKARTNFEKGKIIVKFFLGVDVFWRNMVHHWRDPSGLAQLSKCKFSTSCNAKIVAVLRASSMQPLHSDANWQRQARSVCSRGDAGVTLDIVNHTAEATSRSLSWVLCRAPAENQLREDVVELVAPPPGGPPHQNIARAIWTPSCSDAKSCSQELVLTLPQRGKPSTSGRWRLSG